MRRPASPIRRHAILELKVCDPACGSGHFLIAAAHRMAKRLAAVRTGEAEPTPEAVRHALRDVIGRCIYGVDINSMAVELCKVSLWMEALEPGKPLSFLDHHIQCGNSLLGATPALLQKGIPDAAFDPIESDNKAYCREFKKQNKEERQGQDRLFDDDSLPWEHQGDLAAAITRLESIPDDNVEGVRSRQQRYEELVQSSGYRFGRLLADAWCAAFVWKKCSSDELSYPVTESYFRRIEHNPHNVTPWMYVEIQRLARQYQFFHWHLAFPSVFRPQDKGEKPDSEQAGWWGGFDVVLGNPPWERIKLQDQEWFATRRPDIANARNAAERRQMIELLQEEDCALYQAFIVDRRRAEAESHFIRDSGRYILCGRGGMNTYALFAETNRLLISPTGSLGCILPSGIATDDTTKHYFHDLMQTKTLASLYDFENREKLFPSVDSRMKFSLLTVTGQLRPAREAEFSFWNTNTIHLQDPDRRYALAVDEIALINPNTQTCPVFRSRQDAELTLRVYSRVPAFKHSGIAWSQRRGVRSHQAWLSSC